MKAVFDPNVLASALLSRDGPPPKIILEWLRGSFDLVVSSQLLQELSETLAYPKIRERLTKKDADELIALLKQTAMKAGDPADPPPIRSRDADDDYLLSLAARETAVLVTGDKDLLDIAKKGFPIYSPRQFLDLLER